jgi:DNA-binding response OmpR family regulator
VTKVLVVDDDAATVALLEGILRGQGYLVQTASDGASGLEKAKALVPDILVTDMQMPGLSGNQLAAAIRGIDRLRRVYILVLTAHGEKPDKMKSMLSGADDFLVKPARPEELIGRLEIAQRVLRAERAVSDAARKASTPDAGSRAALAVGLERVREQLDQVEKATDPAEVRARCREARAALEVVIRQLGG